MDVVIRRESLRDAPNREYRDKSILLDVTHADPQAQVHLRGGSADHDGLSAFTSEAGNRQHYARPGHVSFDEQSHKLGHFSGGKLGRLGVEGSNFIDQLAASVVGGRDGGSLARKSVVKERLLQIIAHIADHALAPQPTGRFRLTPFILA